MSSASDNILSNLRLVDAERARRVATVGLVERVIALKHYQQRRFALTYSDLLHSPRYGLAAKFFLSDLYGPNDFSERDAQFARVVPALVRIFPKDIVDTVATLGTLHALSERLDTDTALRLPEGGVSPSNYLAAWKACGDAASRERQITLTLQIGSAIDGFARRPLLRRTLQLMRGPANVAGLTKLQEFLEHGFEAFQSMRGANEFLGVIASREREFASLLFTAKADSLEERAALERLPQ